MTRRVRAVRIVVTLAVAALEVSHPTWGQEGGLAGAVVAAGGWWLALHVMLLLGYGALVWLLWVPATLPRVALLVFLLSNSAFLGVDGFGVGLLANADPEAAERLWNSPLVTVLANLSGAAWAASLLSVAASRTPAARTRPALFGLALTWLTFVASAPPLAAPPIISRIAAVATGASVLYKTGVAAMPFALLVFAAVLHQHVGPEAALGMLLIGVALALAPPPERG